VNFAYRPYRSISGAKKEEGQFVITDLQKYLKG